MVNINKQEKYFLTKQKVQEGKDLDTAHFEVERDQAFQINLSKDLKSLTTENNHLRIKCSKLEKQLEELRKKLIAQSMKESPKESKVINERGTTTTAHCLRILKYLETETDGVNITKIVKDCLVNSQTANRAILFLITVGLVVNEQKNAVNIYKIKRRSKNDNENNNMADSIVRHEQDSNS